MKKNNNLKDIPSFRGIKINNQNQKQLRALRFLAEYKTTEKKQVKLFFADATANSTSSTKTLRKEPNQIIKTKKGGGIRRPQRSNLFNYKQKPSKTQMRLKPDEFEKLGRNTAKKMLTEIPSLSNEGLTIEFIENEKFPIVSNKEKELFSDGRLDILSKETKKNAVILEIITTSLEGYWDHNTKDKDELIKITNEYMKINPEARLNYDFFWKLSSLNPYYFTSDAVKELRKHFKKRLPKFEKLTKKEFEKYVGLFVKTMSKNHKATSKYFTIDVVLETFKELDETLNSFIVKRKEISKIILETLNQTTPQPTKMEVIK